MRHGRLVALVAAHGVRPRVEQRLDDVDVALPDDEHERRAAARALRAEMPPDATRGVRPEPGHRYVCTPSLASALLEPSHPPHATSVWLWAMHVGFFDWCFLPPTARKPAQYAIEL